MLDWLRKRQEKHAEPLRGAPTVHRQKTYSAQSGYVYQYFYLGHRSVAGATEYVFDVSPDRKTSRPVSVIVEDISVAAWTSSHGRNLTATEQYAVAKVALFQAFDERSSPARMYAKVHVRPADIEGILETLRIS